MAYHEHCILVQQKLDMLVPSLIVSYIDQLDLNSCFRHPNWYPWILALCLFSFILCCPCLCSACRGILSPGVLVVLCCYIPVTVVLSIGYGGLAPMHIWLLDVANLCLSALSDLYWKCKVNVNRVPLLAKSGLHAHFLHQGACLWYVCRSVL